MSEDVERIVESLREAAQWGVNAADLEALSMVKSVVGRPGLSDSERLAEIGDVFVALLRVQTDGHERSAR